MIDAYADEYQKFLARTGGDARDMSLRDHFAAKAMQGELAALCDPQNQICGLSLDTSDEQLARLTKHYYRIADSMLKAREQ